MTKSQKRRHDKMDEGTENKRPLKDVNCDGSFLTAILPAISHPFSEIRKLALQKLKERTDLFDFDGKSETIFDLLLAVEEVPLLFENVRERGTQLRRIRYGQLEQFMPKQHAEQLEMLVFRFVLAQFFENLADYWPLVNEIASTFSRCDNVDQLWWNFENMLVFANENLHERIAPAVQLPDSNDDTINKQFQQLYQESETRINMVSIRLELYKLLAGKFAGVAERRHRYLIESLFDIYENEFQAATAKMRRFDDITSATWLQALEDDEKNNEEGPEDSEALAQKLDRKLVKKSLIALMGIFAKFANLKAVHRATEIYDIFNKLLRTNDTQLQKAALSCIFNFKHKSLVPYRQHFDNLVDEKSFRTELLHFSVGEENTTLADEDRSVVIPVLLNLLDGKMHTRTKKNIPRRPLIFRFVASCQPDELELFLQTTFWTISDLIDSTSIRKTCKRIIDNYEPTETLAVARLEGLLDCLDEVYKKLSRSLDDQQNAYVYQVAIACQLLIRLGLEHPKTSNHFRKILRNLRSQSFDLLHTLFNAFQRREFTSDELNVLIEECIRPHLPEKVTDVDLPWSIVKFFGRLTEIPYFYPLLNVPIFQSSDSITPLGILCEALFIPMLTSDNRLFIVERILNLLTFFHELPSAKLPTLRQANLICPESKDRPFGTRLVINYIPRLIAYLKKFLPQEIKSTSSSATVNFSLLEKISAFASDPSLGAEFAATLLPFVEGGFLRSDDNLASVLISIGNFLVHDDQPEPYFRRVTPFLFEFRARKTRDALLQLLRGLQSNPHTSEQLKKHIGNLEQLEAWNPQRINEPDHERRHETMAELSKLYESNAEISVDVIRAYLYSHFYALSYIDELSIRSASANCLRLLVLRLKHAETEEEKEQKQKCLYGDVLALVQRTIKSKNENIRHEAVYLLIILIDEFGDELALIKPLRQLRNAENPEHCFFENVTHLQIYRRQRAFIRLRTGLENNEIELPLETIDKFVMPLVQPYLLQTEQKLIPISDESIRLFAMIMRQQPWAVYHRILTFYIDGINKEVENNKPIIRVLIAVLNAFHFDVANVSLPNGPKTDTQKADRERFKQLAESLKKQKAKKTKRRQFISYTNAKAVKQLAERPPNLTEFNDEEKMNNLSPEQRILATTLRIVIPRLRKCIQAPQEYHSHKKAQQGDKYFADEEEINRAPIAIATVRLLRKLPAWAMDMHLQGVIFTVLNLLLSRSFIVREAARKAVEEIVKMLGPTYLPVVLNDLRQSLTRGYQVHVMIYTVHSLILCLQSELKPGDLDDSFEDIFEVVKEQQFGQVDEEREINAIKSKTPEAKASKASETFTLLGRFITNESLDKFIEPMREIIEQSPKIETYKKLQELLRALSQGLRFNQGVSPVALLEFARTILDQYIEEMSKQQDALRAQELQEKQEREAGYRGKHSLLLAAEPKRVGAVVKTSAKSKVSIFVEFGLQLLGDILTEKHFKSGVEEDVERLNPYLEIVLNALRLKYEKTTSLALRALVILLKFPLISLPIRMSTLVDRLFILLSEYANASGTTKLNVNELNQHLFKAVVSVLRQAPEDLLTKRRLQILLNHVESDLLDPHKQASAFALAKAIISRHIKNEKVDDLIKYLAELSITSPIEQIRIQARATIQIYFRSHPSGVANVERWLRFFLEQLDYEFVHGRLSALESIHALFRQLDKEVVNKHGFATFVRLASRFIEDDDPECHRFASAAMRDLILKVSNSVRNDIYLALSDWIHSDKPGPRYIGARAMTELLKVQEFKLTDERMRNLLDNVVDCHFSELNENSDENEVEVDLKMLIELIRNHLDLVKNALCKATKLQKKLIGGLPSLLTFFEAEPVCFAAATLLEHLLASTHSIWPLLVKHADLVELSNRCIQQLSIPTPSDSFAEETVKNVVTLSVQLNPEAFDTICKQLAVLPKNEIKSETGTSKRVCMFKFMAAQLVNFNADDQQFQSVVDHLGPLLFRELLGKSTKDGEQMLQIATELASILREKVGETEFNALLSTYQIESSKKQAERKRERHELLLADQQLAARQKQKTNARKSQAKKRKIDKVRPYRITKRRRREEIHRTGEID